METKTALLGKLEKKFIKTKIDILAPVFYNKIKVIMKTKMMTMDNVSTFELPKYFKRGKVFIFQNRDFVVIKKSPMIDFSYVRNKLKKIEKNISQQDINQAVLFARRG